MSSVFFCSDHHFWHHNILRFKDDEGNIIRQFDSIDNMHELMIENHNAVVSPNDKVYFLGDVVMRSTDKWFRVLEKMNGTKILIKGNHDNAKLAIYSRYFRDVRSTHLLKVETKIGPKKLYLSHVPYHPMSVGSHFNLHGHLHYKVVPDFRYINCCMEKTNYRPFSYKEVVEICNKRIDQGVFLD